MSRCFPYPPPGYSLNRGSNEALIESIKLEREVEKAKAERKKEKKDKRREKKEKKKEKKDKSNQKINHSSNDEKKTIKVEKNLADLKDKVREAEIEHLERSNLTEEHEKPVWSQNPSSSSDSTQNSSKRKRHIESPSVANYEEPALRGHGNVVRIRLSSQKQKAVEASVNREEPCSTSGRTDVPVPVPGAVKENIFPTRLGINNAIPVVQENIFSTPLRSNNASILRPPRPDRVNKGLICSTSGRTESIIKEDTRTALVSNVVPEKKLSREELKYKKLIENWNPPPLQTGMEFGDEDWLFSTKKNPINHADKKLRTSGNAFCCSSSNIELWPRAQLLSEADIYALPYTVPF